MQSAINEPAWSRLSSAMEPAINQMQSQIQQQTQAASITADTCTENIHFFIKHIKLSTASFPLLPLTYSLWRASAYSRLRNSLIKHNIVHREDHDYLFFQLSELGYLEEFVEKVRNEMNQYCRGMSNIKEQFKGVQTISKEEQETYKTVIELGECMWEQQLYLQLIEDLIRLPYLEIIQSKSAILIRPEYSTGFQTGRSSGKLLSKMADSIGKSFFNRAINSVTEILFSKAFAFQISTLVGTFNPILMGASFGISQYIKKLDSKRKEDQIVSQVACALEHIKIKLDEVKGTYYRCLNLMDRIIGRKVESQQQMNKLRQDLKTQYLSIYEQEWLQIETVKQQDGWQLVRLEEKDSFQELS